MGFIYLGVGEIPHRFAVTSFVIITVFTPKNAAELISSKRFDVALISGCAYENVMRNAKHIKSYLSTKRHEEQPKLSLTCQSHSFYTSTKRNCVLEKTPPRNSSASNKHRAFVQGCRSSSRAALLCTAPLRVNMVLWF